MNIKKTISVQFARKNIIKKLRRNDIAVKIYFAFAVVLAVSGLLIGVIFIKLYKQNYIKSYTDLLVNQGKTISVRIAKLSSKDRLEQFLRYSKYVDELENAENTDIWIVSNEDADEPLEEDYTNASPTDGSLTPEMYEVIKDAYKGKISSNASYDDVYGMTILRVAVPVYNKKNKEVNGAIMMISMIDKQTMGIDKGIYLMVISIFSAFILSYVIAFGASKYLSKPLKKLSRDIDRISQGDYIYMIPKNTRTQLGRLEANLNIMAKKLGKAEEERQNLDQVRRDFFANVSHELRTPITVMRGYAETLNDGVITDTAVIEDMYQRMLSECQGMERLVGDLFILSKMQNPDFEIEKEPVSLMQVFGDINRSARMIGKEKNIKFVSKFPEEDPCLMLGDYGRLRQMFMVIIDNAVKFSDENGEISIKIWKDNGRLHVSISDNGVGISDEELPYIFEKFYKSKLKQNEKGTGLGLMIAKQIALRHNGDIKVESQKGAGTTFYFEFEECEMPEDFY